MARIKYTALVESIKGSIQGTTFQANAYGYTIKGKPNMLNPNTQFQNVSKSRFSRATQEWKNLTSGNRAAWDAYANNFPIPSRKNPDAYLSGFAAFTRWQALSNLFSGSILADPSGDQGTIDASTPQIELITNQLYILPDVSSTEGPWVLHLFMTRPLSPTQTFLKSWLRHVITLPDSQWVDEEITAQYIQRFGNLPAEGDLVGCQQVYQNTTNGQVYYNQSEIVTVT
jgi:hypothetical protein